MFDVAALMEDSETKTSALEKVAELEDELGHVSFMHSFIYFLVHFLLILKRTESRLKYKTRLMNECQS